jgi:hypothetical protein
VPVTIANAERNVREEWLEGSRCIAELKRIPAEGLKESLRLGAEGVAPAVEHCLTNGSSNLSTASPSLQKKKFMRLASMAS